VEPYFKGADGAEAPFRPVTEGDVIQLQLGAQLAEFKVVETEPPRHCIVSPETAIDMEEEPLERSVEEVLRGRRVKPSLCPSLAILDEVRDDAKIRRLLFCGVGCAVQALRAMGGAAPEEALGWAAVRSR